MSADGVVEHFDVAEDIAVRLWPRRIGFSADALPLKQLEEAFSNCVVVTVSSPAHTRLQVVASKEALSFMACKLAALVRVHGLGMNRTGFGGG